MSTLDRFLSRFTMYRLVIAVLAVVGVWALVAAAAGWLDPSIFGVGPMLLTLAVLVVASAISNEVLGRVVGARPHRDSAIITALLLWFLYWPTTEPATLGWLAVVALLATASKYVIAVRRRHLVNPAAAGVVLATLLGWAAGIDAMPFTTWWAASEILFPVVLVGALLILRRTRRVSLGLVFAAVAVPLVVSGLTAFGSSVSDALWTAVTAYPVVFFAGFMLSEPLTLPPRRHQQWAVGVLAAVIFAWPLWSFAAFGTSTAIGPFEGTYELALVATGLVSFLLGPRGQIGLTFRERRPLGGDVYEYWFDADRPLRFTPGQYLELYLPHGRADGRGMRRILSIASPPGREVAVAVREPEGASSFKRALAQADAGSRWTATAVHGDFVLPRDDAKVALIAGGIGITPFMSQLRAGTGDHDVVLVYGVRDGNDVPYADELAALGVDVRLVVGDVLDADSIAAAVPDLDERVAYISGSPAMVDTIRRALRGRARRIRVDHFLGY
ncbi:oxidoreductase [Aeromicrobium camelliae]|uniref:Oxidoreductase n=2 Tax=Aeromicrobium TaxID=2040 RepID=A0A3N6X7M8_9ACTN|nr:FAD-dependent oxidoreductase [Aeromicrobium camelliae]RQN09638.1 oxidoreductase [Aeromicrobium camelliae]